MVLFISKNIVAVICTTTVGMDQICTIYLCRYLVCAQTGYAEWVVIRISITAREKSQSNRAFNNFHICLDRKPSIYKSYHFNVCMGVGRPSHNISRTALKRMNRINILCENVLRFNNF